MLTSGSAFLIFFFFLFKERVHCLQQSQRAFGQVRIWFLPPLSKQSAQLQCFLCEAFSQSSTVLLCEMG